MSHDYLFKFILVGDSSVGKSSLLLAGTPSELASQKKNNRPAPVPMPTVGVDFKTRVVTIDSKNILIMTWDTAGRMHKPY